MALTKAQVSLVTVATLGAAAGGFKADLMNFGTQKEVAALALSVSPNQAAQTNAEFALQVAKNLGVSAGDKAVTDLFNALEGGATRADAAVDFANGQLVAQGGKIANVETAMASSSESTDLGELQAIVSNQAVKSGTTIVFKDNDKNQTEATANKQTIGNIGKDQLDAGLDKKSVDFTFELKNQIGENDVYNGLFLSPIIDRELAGNTSSQIFLELLDLRAEEAGKLPLERVPVDTFAFYLNGAKIIVQSDDIYAANDYDALFLAIKNRVEELGKGIRVPATDDKGVASDLDAYAELVNFTVELDGNFTVKNQNGDDVSGKKIKLTDAGGAKLDAYGFVNKMGVVEEAGYTLYAQMKNIDSTPVQKDITTTLDANNVGYGSQGATVNIAGQSASDKGIEKLNVITKNGSWFTKLESKAATNHLESIEVQIGSNGYFNVGTQKNANTHVVDLAHENFNKAGLFDVIKVNADNAGSAAINAYVSDAVVARDGLDATGVYTVDNSTTAINYSLNNAGNNVLNLAVDKAVMETTVAGVTINTGSGSDLITFQVSNGLNADGTIKAAGNGNWLTNQQLLNNLEVNAGNGDNHVVMSGAGNATITTGNGSDIVRADNTGDRGVFVFNSDNQDINDLLSNSDKTNSSGVVIPVTQSYNLIKGTVIVEFLGFTAFANIDSASGKTTTLQINQAIKNAIAGSDQLKKLLAVHNNEGKALGIESLVDGLLAPGDLNISIKAPANYDKTELPAAKAAREAKGQQTLTDKESVAADGVTATDYSTAETAFNNIYNDNKFVTVNGVEVKGANSSAESDNVINLGGGNDLVMMGTGAKSNDTLKLTGYNNGVNTIVNFDNTASGAGQDFLDLNFYVKGAGAIALPTSATTGNSQLSNNAVIKLTADAKGFAKLTASELVKQLNDTATATILPTDQIAGVYRAASAADTRDTALVKNVSGNYVVMVENTENLGEFKVFHLKSPANINDGLFSNNAEYIATLDFGDTNPTVDYTTATLVANVDASGALSFDTAGLDVAALTDLTIKVGNLTAGVDNLTLSAAQLAQLATIPTTANLTFDFKALGANGDVVKVAAGSTVAITNLTVTGGTLDISAAAGFVVSGTTTLNSNLIATASQLKAMTGNIVSNSATASGVTVVITGTDSLTSGELTALAAKFGTSVSLKVVAGSDSTADKDAAAIVAGLAKDFAGEVDADATVVVPPASTGITVAAAVTAKSDDSAATYEVVDELTAVLAEAVKTADSALVAANATKVTISDIGAPAGTVAKFTGLTDSAKATAIDFAGAAVELTAAQLTEIVTTNSLALTPADTITVTVADAAELNAAGGVANVDTVEVADSATVSLSAAELNAITATIAAATPGTGTDATITVNTLDGATVAGTALADTFTLATGDAGVSITGFNIAADSIKGFGAGVAAATQTLAATNDVIVFTGNVADDTAAALFLEAQKTAGVKDIASGTADATFAFVDGTTTTIFSYSNTDSAAEFLKGELTLVGTITSDSALTIADFIA